MKVFHNAQDIHTWLSMQPHDTTIGFVPTMGALHEGHMSLIDRAKQENTLVVCSIFVNPTQFNDPKDLEKYPRTLEQDLLFLMQRQCDVVFLPTEQEIYSNSAHRERSYDLGHLEERWEGAKRPGHFQGVCMVVQRLLEIIPTHRLYLGQKDFQQFLILRHMIKQILQWSIEVIPCSIVREPDGLAMSSRNVRLTAVERKDSLVLSQALQQLADFLPTQPLDQCLSAARQHITQAKTLINLEYIAVVNPIDLAPATSFKEADTLLAIVAVQFPSARLIDNKVVKGSLEAQ